MWMLASGNWLFRYRNSLFPILFVVLALVTHPGQFMNKPQWDRVAMAVGATLALAGQAFRLLTIGFAYIKRGGLNGKVYANDLVVAGLYAHTRNPMYVGNLLITIGVSIFYGSLWMYMVIIPFFIWVYLAITAAEEHYLLGKFGPTYRDYMQSVNRFIPDFRGLTTSLAGFRYQWRTVLAKEYNTVYGTFTGLTLIAWWKAIHVEGRDTARENIPLYASLIACWTLFYVVIRILKKTGRLREPIPAES